MGKLIYLLNVSLDGFIETPDHSLAWTSVDDELHTWFNDHMRTLAASLYGRRLYEVMSAYWPNYESDPDATEPMREFGRIWNATPRIVFSSTLDRVDFNSRLVRGDVGTDLERARTEFDGDLEVAVPPFHAKTPHPPADVQIEMHARSSAARARPYRSAPSRPACCQREGALPPAPAAGIAALVN